MSLLRASLVMGFSNWLRRLRTRREVAELEQVPAVTYVQEAGRSDIAVYVSPQVEALTGYSTKDFEEDPSLWYGVIHPDDMGRVLAEDERTDATGEPFSMEYRIVRRDGRLVWVRDEAVLVEDDEGGPRLWQGVMIDVTERKRIEAALHESEQRFRGAFENASTGVALVGLDRRYLRVNRALCEMLGYSEEELLSKTSNDITHPEDREASRERSERLLAGEAESDISEKRYLRKDGETVWVLSSVSLVRDTEENPSHFVSQFQDITQRKRAEEALKESEERFRALVQNASDMVIVTEADRTVRYVSPAVEQVLGRRAEDLTGKDDFDIMHPEDVPHARRFFVDILKRPGVASTLELRLRHADGSWRYIEARCTNLLEDPAVKGVVINCRDVTERRRAEEHLRETEERYRTLVETIPAMTYVQEIGDGTSATTYVSPQVWDVVGYTQEECTSTPDLWVKILHPDDRERVLAEDRRTNETGEPFVMEYRQFHRDGSVVWLRDEATLVRDEEGKPLYWLGVQMDITERKRTEERLRQSEEHFRRSFEDAAIGMALVATDGHFLQVNDALCRIVGYEQEELLQKTFQEITHPDDLQDDLDLMHRTLSGESQTYQMEKRYFHKEGHVVWVLLGGSLVRADGGEPLHFVAQIQDITESKLAAERLREAEARYRTLVEQIPAGVYIQEIEHEGAIAYISPKIEDILGYSPQEYVENPRLWIETTHPDDRERVLAEDERTDETGEPFRIEFRKISRDGRVIWIRDEAVLVRDAEGNPLYWQGIFFDITERKVAEEQLRESTRRLSTLLSNAPAYLYRCRNAPLWPNEFVSDYAFELTGYTPEELTDGTVMYGDLIVEEDRERVWDEVQAALSAGEGFELQYSIRCKDGEVRHVEERGQGVYGDDGEVEAIEGVVYDVTERVRAEEALREAEERYRTLVEQIPAVTYIDLADSSFESVYTSPQIEEMLGYTQEEWQANKLWEKRLHPDDRERVLAADDRLEIEGEPFSEEYRLLAKDGSVVWVREEAVLIRDEEGEPLYWQGIIFDMTERKVAEEQLRKSQASLAEAQRMAHLGSWEWDLRTGEVDWSDETFRLYGFEPRSFVPTFESLLEVVHPGDRKLLQQEVDAALDEGRPYDFEHRIVKPDGEVRVVHRRAELVRTEDGEPIRMVGTVHDVTERKALEEQLQHQALHDPLTGLPNRTLFADRLRQALARAKRREAEVSVLFMDLDNFKVINDSLGHKAGDRLLVAASKRIKALLRPEDTVARLGGDEFIFLLEDAGTQDAVHVAERVLEQMQNPFLLGGRRLFVSASIGVATAGSNGKYAADLLRNADMAMYRAKHSGKARHAVFEEAMNTRALERLEMEHGLRRALERGELKVYYQPQMLLDADMQRSPRSRGSRIIVPPRVSKEPQIVGTEALVRWEHPERGLLLPGEFVPLAEETGLIVPIGEMVLEEACRRTREWQERFAADPPLSVYVNLSARQFREPDLPRAVSRILNETGLDPTSLHLEITESTAMSDAPATISMLEDLTTIGVRLVIDDFGTGYSSLSYLERFPVDYVKIDRSFVGGLETEAGATALVSGMISLAHALGIRVIAEGVERAGQLERVHAMGCDLAQGRYFSGPLPYEGMVELLSNSTFQ